MTYLDHNATTPVDPRVVAAMEPYWTSRWGNPSSVHAAGRAARRAVEDAREQVAALLGASEPDEIVFTSGGTEADAMAVFSARGGERRSVAVSTVEHPAVAGPSRTLESEGFCRRELPVRPSGEIDIDEFRRRIDPSVGLVSVMWANNEYGGLFPIRELAEVTRAVGAVFHSDAVAALGKTAVSAGAGPDLISISAHKVGGPKGTGALYVRRGIDLAPLFPGGGQERRRRGGTENVAGIVGFGEAARICAAESAAERGRLAALRDAFERGVIEAWPGAAVWGSSAPRIPNTSAIAFAGASGEALAIALDLEGIAVSTGSACSSGTVAPSASILALGAPRDVARSTVRFSFGAGNRDGDVARTVAVLARIARDRDLDRGPRAMRK